MANRIRNHITVGTNVYSADWSSIRDSFFPLSNFIAGDFSNFDGSLRPEILRYIGEKIDDWYGDIDNPVRTNVWAEVYMSKHVQGSRYYQFKQGLPSGHPLTSIINSIYNLSALYYAFDHIFVDLGVDYKIENHVHCQVYGDDNVIALSDPVAELVDPKILPVYLADLGLKYGNAFKDGADLTYINIEDVQFLKRGFRVDDNGCCLAPLSYESLFETLNWTKRGHMCDEIMIGKIDNFFLELSLHGEEEFLKHAPRIHKLAQEHYYHSSPYCNYVRALTKVLTLEARW